MHDGMKLATLPTAPGNFLFKIDKKKLALTLLLDQLISHKIFFFPTPYQK